MVLSDWIRHNFSDLLLIECQQFMRSVKSECRLLTWYWHWLWLLLGLLQLMLHLMNLTYSMPSNARGFFCIISIKRDLTILHATFCCLPHTLPLDRSFFNWLETCELARHLLLVHARWSGIRLIRTIFCIFTWT